MSGLSKSLSTLRQSPPRITTGRPAAPVIVLIPFPWDTLEYIWRVSLSVRSVEFTRRGVPSFLHGTTLPWGKRSKLGKANLDRFSFLFRLVFFFLFFFSGECRVELFGY